MNNPGSIGEPSCNSCKRQENGDGYTESERPLKKARFAWQVKGRYHLKNEIPDSRTPLNTHESNSVRSSAESESDSKELAGNTEQNLEILGDYLLKQDFNTLDSITESEQSLLPSTSLSTEKLSYPRYISSSNMIINENVTNADLCNISNSVVSNNSKSDFDDQCIARWQARQMAKCYVDNTINRVLDNWMVAPRPTDVDSSRFLAFDVAEFINNLPVGNSLIENEGILMAISAHGLQNTSNSSNDSTNFSLQNSDLNKDLLPLSPSNPDEDIHDPNLSFKESETESSSNEMDMSWLYTENVKQSVNNDLPLTFFPEVSSSSYQSYNETEDVQNSNEYDADDNMNFKDNNIINNHYDFLDAAVSFAIQYKGLTSLGTDG